MIKYIYAVYVECYDEVAIKNNTKDIILNLCHI